MNVKFVSRCNIYKDNNGALVVEKHPMVTVTSKNISAKYHCFKQNVGKDFAICKFKSENNWADIFTKCLQGELFVKVKKFQYGW